MTNLEITNQVIENNTVNFELQYSMEKIKDGYLEELESKVENVWRDDLVGEVDEIRTKYDDVDDINWFICCNIKDAIESKINLNERYETISLVVTLG